MESGQHISKKRDLVGDSLEIEALENDLVLRSADIQRIHLQWPTLVRNKASFLGGSVATKDCSPTEDARALPSQSTCA